MKVLHIFAAVLLAFFVSTANAAKLNINSASAAEIAAEMKGVNPKLADAIVPYRKANGPFKSLEDLDKVKGIGATTLENNKNIVSFSKPSWKRKKAQVKRNEKRQLKKAPVKHQQQTAAT